MKIVNQSNMAIWYQPNGAGTAYKLLGLGISSASGRTVPGPNKTILYGTNRYGLPAPVGEIIEAPNGQPGMTIAIYDRAKVPEFETMMNLNCPVAVQIRIVLCGVLDHPTLWDAIDHHGGGLITQRTLPDGPSTPYSGQPAQQQATLVFDDVFRIVRISLSRLNLSKTVSLNSMIVVTDARCGGDCDDGYPGADKLMVVAGNAPGGGDATLAFSRNGGGSFADIAAAPFTTDEHIGPMDWQWVDNGVYRVVFGCITTDAGAKAKLGYADLTIGDEENAVPVEVVSTSGDISNGDVVTALLWPTFERLYVATTGGVITILDSQGEIWDQDEAANAGVAINCFAASYDKETVYAAGASNAILRETEQSGTFVARVGPSGGGAFTALGVAADGTLYAGNGQSLYKSNNGAANAGGWSQIKDFGANNVVRAILFVGVDRSQGGDSQVLRVVVDNTVAGSGTLWESLDGGASFRQITSLTNSGYNGGVHSRADNNKLWIPGDANGGTSLVHVASGA